MSNVANPMSKDQEHTMQGKSEGKGFGSGIAHQAEEAGTYLADKANQASEYVSEQASKMASSAMHSAENAGKYMGQKAADTRHSVGSSIKSMGESLKSAAPEGVMHDAACSLGETLTSTGQYLDEHGISAMTEDLTNVIKRNPLPAVFIAAGIGFLLAKACTSSRSSY
jgi:ElaB/YqjD/DUF883 family membrane-anchored ribosome-binding protein